MRTTTRMVTITAVLALLALPLASVRAATTEKLPGFWTYAYEWLDLRLLTWKGSTKVTKLSEYATVRAQNMVTATDLNQTTKLEDLTERYAAMVTEMNTLMVKKNLADKTTLAEQIQTRTLEQQRLLSTVRQTLQNEDQQQTIAQVQEQSVNQVRNTIETVSGPTQAETFVDEVVGTWRDPSGTVTAEKETRVYAAGTTATGVIDNNGVIIDSGTAKITQGSTGDLKIEYAPGTGPSSAVNGDGKAIWKIVQSDGTTIESYTAGSTVVVGQGGGTASNVVVNTVTVSTGGERQVVAGQGQGGTSGVTVVGGPTVVVTSPTSEGGSASPGSAGNSGSSGQTIINQ